MQIVRSRSPSSGFTLIEILIVISIIALLASMILVAIQKARGGASEAICKQEVSSLSQALEQYVQDEADYPGMSEKLDPDRNDFPLFFDAIFGDRKPAGPGGRSAPYTKYEESKVAVYDTDTDLYRPATREEIRDKKVKKYLLDPWGNPYQYRCNKGKEFQDYMHNQYGSDIYSWGPNEKDDTIEPGEKPDDIGNW
jgi:prepilin-type N-terminal cleavage/methylation domain-containing protein